MRTSMQVKVLVRNLSKKFKRRCGNLTAHLHDGTLSGTYRTKGCPEYQPQKMILQTRKYFIFYHYVCSR